METELIEKAKNYIKTHLTEPFTLEDIANICGYSKYHFSREFYKKTGMNIMDFARKERISAAKDELLLNKSIFSIAIKFGFDTHNGFTNAFFQYIGCNPSDFRKHKQKSLNYIKGDFEMNNASIVIRPIEMTDVNGMWENVFSANTPEEIKERIQRDLDGFEDRTHFHVVAEVDKIVIGTLGCGRSNKYSFYANLGDFVIHPDYQSKGLARKMLEKVIELIKDINIDTLHIQCEIDSETTRDKYVSLGFTEVFKTERLIYLMMAL